MSVASIRNILTIAEREGGIERVIIAAMVVVKRVEVEGVEGVVVEEVTSTGEGKAEGGVVARKVMVEGKG